MKNNYYEIIVSYDEDQKLSVWWRLDSNVKNTLGFLRLKEGQDKPEQTTERRSFGHYSFNELHQMNISMIVQSDFNYESDCITLDAQTIMKNERAKTVSCLDFLLLRKEFDRFKEQVEYRLKIED